MGTSPDNFNTTKLIEKFVGTEFDMLKELHANLSTLVALNSNLEEQNNKDQGVLDEAPSTRSDGTALQTGDRYFNSIQQVTYYYVNGNWISSNNILNTAQVHTVVAEDIVGSDTVIQFDNAISQFAGGNMVFVGAAYQYSTTADPSGAYSVTGPNEITFAGTALQVGEVVICITGSVVSTLEPVITVQNGIYLAETADQTEIPLPNDITYTPGAGNLVVYKNGVFLNTGIDYVETSTSSITVVTPVAQGTVFTFRKGNLVSTEQSPQNDVVTLPLLSSFNPNLAFLQDNQDKAVIVKGGYTLSDGSGGVFIYDPTFDRSLCNGVTAIDATKSIGLQGSGVGNGAWIRQYEGFLRPEWFNTAYTGMAALRFMQGIDGDKAHINGFYEGSLSGGGVFVWDSSVPKEDHNGGTIISPNVIVTPGTASWYTAPATGEDGCWVRQSTGEITTDQFGADSTGTANSDAAFVAMVALATPVKVNVGTYSVTAAHAAQFYSLGTITVNGGGSITIDDLLV